MIKWIQFLAPCDTYLKAMCCWFPPWGTGWEIKIFLWVDYWECFRNNILQWVREAWFGRSKSWTAMQLQQNLLSNPIRITGGGTTLARCLKWRQESQAFIHSYWPITECRLFSGRRIILGELPLFIWGHCLEGGLISKPSTGDSLNSKGNENLYLLGFWVAHHSIHFKINQ